MKRHLSIGLALALFAGAVVAAPPAIDLFRWVQGGLTVGRRDTPPGARVHNTLTDIRGLYHAYTFGALLAPAWGNVTGGCTPGPTPALPGTRMGDRCFVSSDRSNWDGGLPDFVRFECEVPSPGYVKLRACVSSNDGGVAISLLDAGYFFETHSFLPNP